MKQIFRLLFMSFSLVVTGLSSVCAQQNSGEIQDQESVWEAWLSENENRADFWNEKGWVISDSQKAEAALDLIPCNTFERQEFGPLQCGLTPHATLPVNYRLPDGGVLQLHSIARLDVLYRRYTINTSAK